MTAEQARHGGGAERAGISVVVPTKDRPAELMRALASLAAQDRRPRRVVVVDQSRQSVEAEARQVLDGIALTYVLDRSITGASAARNRGLEHVDTELVAFVDDDEVLEASYLAELSSVYERIPSAQGVSGVPSNYAGVPLAYRLWASVWLRGPFHDDRQAHYWRAAKGPFDPVPVSRFGAGVSSFRVDALHGLRFDEGLTGACVGEDVDLSSRLPPGTLWMTGRARLLHLHSAVRSREHWLVVEARANCYLYRRLWSRGIRNRACYAWLRLGLALTAALVSLRRGEGSVLSAVLREARSGPSPA